MSFSEVLTTIQMVLFFIIMFFWGYQLFICLFAFSKEKKKPRCIHKNFKFMAVIPARNEENVIRDIIRSLKNQTYQNLDIYVIADNCSDHTARDASFEGAIVYERTDPLKRTKGYALHWFFNKILHEKPDEYDAFCIFDADNLVKEDFFEKMNEKFCEGEVIVQGYRDIRNPGDTWVSDNYAIYYWTENRLYHFARYQIGLSPLVNGTGFAVSMELLKKSNGFYSETLTEDIEFSIENIMKGYKVAWAKDAIVYDEEPTKFSASITQRLRWSVGHIQCLKKFFPQMIGDKKVNATKLDMFIYILGMPLFLVSLGITLINITKVLFFKEFTYMNLIGGLKFTATVNFITVLQAIFVTILEGKNIKKVWKGIATYPIFLLSWLIVNVMAFFTPKLEWKQIVHVGEGGK